MLSRILAHYRGAYRIMTPDSKAKNDAKKNQPGDIRWQAVLAISTGREAVGHDRRMPGLARELFQVGGQVGSRRSPLILRTLR
jgi:hypothetical protein